MKKFLNVFFLNIYIYKSGIDEEIIKGLSENEKNTYQLNLD